jgi:hypothetical protein
VLRRAAFLARVCDVAKSEQVQTFVQREEHSPLHFSREGALRAGKDL